MITADEARTLRVEANQYTKELDTAEISWSIIISEAAKSGDGYAILMVAERHVTGAQVRWQRCGFNFRYEEQHPSDRVTGFNAYRVMW